MRDPRMPREPALALLGDDFPHSQVPQLSCRRCYWTWPSVQLVQGQCPDCREASE